MEFPIKFDTAKSGWSIVHIEGSQVIISKNIIFLSLKIDFVIANSVDPDEMPHYVAFHLGLQCSSKYPFRGFWYTQRVKIVAFLSVLHFIMVFVCLI